MSTVTLLDSTVQPTVAVSSHVNKNLLSVAVANTSDLTNFLGGSRRWTLDPSLVTVEDGTAVTVTSNGGNLDSYWAVEGDVGCGKITSQLRPDPYPAAGSDEELRKRTVSGQIYVPSDVFNATSKPGRAFKIVVFYKNGGTYHEVASAAATVPDSWVDLSVTVEVPPTATEAFIRLYNGTEVTTDGVRFRHLKVESGSTNTGWIAPTSNTQDSQNILSKWENESNITAEDANPTQTILNGSANGSQYSRLLTANTITLDPTPIPINTNIYGVTVKVKARALTNHVSQNVNTCGATLNNITGFSKVNGDETITTSGGVLTIATPGTTNPEGVSWHATGLTIGKQYTVQINANIPDGAQVALVNYTTGTSVNWTIVNSIGMYATRALTFTANATDNVIHLQTTTAHAWYIEIKNITVVRDTTEMQLKAFATNSFASNAPMGNPTVTLDTAFVNTASGSNNIKRTSTTVLTEEYAWVTLGSNKDQWGWKLLRELILDANFGTAIQFKTSSSEDAEALVQVDDVQLDVTYYYPESDLQATIKTDHQTLFVGEVALIEYLIVNNGPCPATNVVATIALPASFTMQYSTLVKGTYANGTWTIPTLANGETAKLHILAEATAEGTTTASVTSSVDDPTTINNSASYTFNIQTITATTDSNIGFWYDGGYSQQYGIPYCSEIVRNMRGETTDAVMDISRRDGTIPVGQDDSARKIDVTFPIIGTDYEDLRTKVKNIAGWLKTNRIGNNHPETAELIFDDDPTHKYNVYPQGEIPAPQEFSKVAATVSFYLPIPYAEKRWLVLSGPAGNNEGTVATYPTVTLIAEAVTELKVINQQTQQEIAINHTFGGGEKVIIDCDKRTVYADDVDLRSQVEFTSSFFKLWPGVFEITSVGGSISAVAYKELSY